MPWWKDEKMAEGQNNKRICLAAVVVIKRTWPKTNTPCGKASPRLCASDYTAGFTGRVEAVGNLRIGWSKACGNRQFCLWNDTDESRM